MERGVLISSMLLLFIVDSRAQYFNFDFFNIPPTTKYIRNDYPARRTKINTVRTNDPDTQIQWKNTSISYVYEDVDKDERIQPARAKKRKQAMVIPTLAPIFNYFTTTTQRTTKKYKRISGQRTTVSNTNESKRKLSNNVRPSYEVDLQKNRQINNVFVNPDVSDDYFPRPYNGITTRPNDYYNNNNNLYIKDTTKNPLLNRPGVKPAVVDNRPPITNKPPTRRPDSSHHGQGPIDSTPKPTPTPRPYIVNPVPTDAGAVVFPHENEEPVVITAVDEDHMSEAEKRRYIESAERMCDKYKSLNTKQLSAIPLLPSPEPVSVNVSQCSPLNVPLVIGGKVVSIKDFPHAALLGWEKIDEAGYSWKCGGSLISDRWILTAAHCSYEERDNTVVTGPPRVVQLGSTYLDDSGALVVRVASVVRHPKYKFPKSYYDIALLKLVQPVKFSEVIRPACLGVPPAVGDPIIAIGWGKTQLGGDLSQELRAVSIPIWDLGRCKELLGTSRKMPDGPLSDSQVCAGEERGGKDTCQGDSGGPAQIQDGCVWRVVAVTSLGRSCGAPNTPGLYAIAQRAFIAATVFGDQKTNNRRSDNSQTNNNNRQNDQPKVNDNNNHNTYDVSNNDRRNDNPNVNNNDKIKHNTYDVGNSDRQNDYPNVNSNNDRRQNDYTTTESYYNYNNRRTTTTTEPYYNHNYNNRNHDENGYNQSENRRDYDSSGYTNSNPTYNDNKRTEYDTSYYDDNNSRTSPNNHPKLDYDNVRHNQQNNQNHYQNNQRQNSGNHNYWNENPRPNYYGRTDDAPIWWT